MTGQSDNNWENRINQIVEEAVESMDFERLEQNIRGTIDSVFEEWKIGPGTNRRRSDQPEGFERWQDNGQNGRQEYRTRSTPSGSQTVQRRTTRTVYTSGRQQGRGSYQAEGGLAAKAPRRFPRSIPGSISSTVCTVLGAIGVSIFGSSTLISMFALGINEMMGIAVAALAPFLIGSGYLLWKGVTDRRRIHRFQTYINVLGTRTYCSIEELAKAVHKKPAFVVRDLQKMFRKRFFLQGHVDAKQTTLMTDDETYQQYLTAQESYQARMEQAKNKEEVFETDGIENSELAKALAEGNAYIKEIREANEQIPGEEISRKLYRLEDVLKKIFLVLEKDPKQLPKMRKFMTYYMPTTRKLVQTYKELDSNTVGGDNITNAKKEIEQTLDTINDAYEKLLDSFYEDAVIDIKSDRTVLESMLTQDGLGSSPFEEKKLRRGQQ